MLHAAVFHISSAGSTAHALRCKEVAFFHKSLSLSERSPGASVRVCILCTTENKNAIYQAPRTENPPSAVIHLTLHAAFFYFCFIFSTILALHSATGAFFHKSLNLRAVCDQLERSTGASVSDRLVNATANWYEICQAPRSKHRSTAVLHLMLHPAVFHISSAGSTAHALRFKEAAVFHKSLSLRERSPGASVRACIFCTSANCHVKYQIPRSVLHLRLQSAVFHFLASKLLNYNLMHGLLVLHFGNGTIKGQIRNTHSKLNSSCNACIFRVFVRVCYWCVLPLSLLTLVSIKLSSGVFCSCVLLFVNALGCFASLFNNLMHGLLVLHFGFRTVNKTISNTYTLLQLSSCFAASNSILCIAEFRPTFAPLAYTESQCGVLKALPVLIAIVATRALLRFFVAKFVVLFRFRGESRAEWHL